MFSRSSFSSGDMRRMFDYRYIVIFTILQTPVAVSTDACRSLANIQGTQYEVIGRPFCDYADKCVGITLHDSVVSCKEAYEAVTRLTVRPISVPPIVRIYPFLFDSDIDQEERDYQFSVVAHNFSSCAEPLLTLLNQLEHVADRFASRIIEFNYRYIYEESIDGPLLRNFTQLSRDIADTGECRWFCCLPEHRKHVRYSESMRRLGRYIQHQLHYLASRPMHETELVASSMAPWLHAFLYSLHQMGILYPQFLVDYGYALQILVRYHPQYTSDDGVWYILLDSQFWFSFSNESYFKRNENSSWEDVEDLFFANNDVVPPRNASLLLTLLAYELGLYFDDANAGDFAYIAKRIERIVYALEIIHISGEEGIDLPIDDAAMSHITSIIRYEHPHQSRVNHVTTQSLQRVFSRYLTLVEKAEILIPLPNYLPCVREIDLDHNFTLRYHPGTGYLLDEIVHDLLALSHDDMFLTLQLKMGWTNRTEIPDARTLITQILDLFLSPIADTFDPFAGDWLDDINDHYRDIQIALGRFIALLMTMDCTDSIVGRYIVGKGPSSTIFETVFFNSRFVKQGFYDLFLGGTLETIFENGQEFVDAIQAKYQTDPEEEESSRSEDSSLGNDGDMEQDYTDSDDDALSE